MREGMTHETTLSPCAKRAVPVPPARAVMWGMRPTPHLASGGHGDTDCSSDLLALARQAIIAGFSLPTFPRAVCFELWASFDRV